MYKQLVLSLFTLSLLGSCKEVKKEFDATGSFEAEETIVSSESTGAIKLLNIEEGQLLAANQVIGQIDNQQLLLKKKQLQAQIGTFSKKLPDIGSQTSFYAQQLVVTQTRLNNLIKEQKRFQNLVNADAATPKQLDDINAQIEETQKQLLVITKQKEAQVSALSTQTSSINGESAPIQVQIEQIDDQLTKCKIINPLAGTVLSKYAEVNEMTTTGKPLYKIADLSTITLRAYITGNQLPQVKLNQQVKVLTDDGKGGYKENSGQLVWINDKAEFTPKTIQTKEERANMVYAVKIKVKNDGYLKIGMYGEVKFN